MVVQNFHVYAGAEVGLLKGVDPEKGTYSNLNSLEGLDKDDEITAMCWGDSTEKRIYTGHKGQVVKTFDCETNCFVGRRDCQAGSGSIKGLCHVDGNLITAAESGIVKLWKEDDSEGVEINTGDNLCAMLQNPFTNSQVATGGKESDLKVWDLQNPKSTVFTAKNVKNDFLDLRVPVWIMDLKFRSDKEIVTCTRHHQVRLYDMRAQRRPVVDMEFERHPLMSVSLAHNEQQVVVGSSRGRVALLDLRRKLLVHVFKGFAGSVRSVKCHPTLPLVASCGLDRFLRIHDLNRHKLLHKVYLKTRLNCLLYKTVLTTEEKKEEEDKETPAMEDEMEEEDNLWESMKVVKEKKKRHLSTDAKLKAKKKKAIQIDEA